MLEEMLIGVDEAGRGPLAGPVAVGVVAIPLGFDVLAEFPQVKDSKQLSAQKRELIFNEVERRASRGDLQFAVRFSSHEFIDRFGITRAVQEALSSGVRELAPPSHATVMLDGLLHAPKSYRQRTVIHGDALVPIIGLASILAKVTRDRTMEQLSRFYPEYGFEQHKGYGTQQHYRALRMHGLCDIHRRTYCKSV
jgi:ribonuclease HII